MSWILSSNQIFHFLIAIFYTSVTGSIAVLCVILLQRLLRKRDYIKTCYCLLCGSLWLFLFPILYIFTIYLDRKHNLWNGILFLHTPFLSKIIPWIMIIWIIGFIATFIFQLIPALALHQQKKHMIPCESHVQKLFNELCRDMHMSQRGIHLFQSYSTFTPFCFRVFCPLIVIPIQSYTDEELQIILTHELTHICNKDICFKYLLILIKSIHFFNPCVWILTSRFEHWSEYVCDNETTKYLGYSKKYFTTILKYTTLNQQPSRIMSALGYGPLTTKQRLVRYAYYQKQTSGNLLHLLPRLIPIIVLSITIILGSIIVLTNGYEHIFYATCVEEIEISSPAETLVFQKNKLNAATLDNSLLIQTAEDIPIYDLEDEIHTDTLLTSDALFLKKNEQISLNAISDPIGASLVIGLVYPDGSHLCAEYQFPFDHNISITESGYYKIFFKNNGDETVHVGCTISIH